MSAPVSKLPRIVSNDALRLFARQHCTVLYEAYVKITQGNCERHGITAFCLGCKPTVYQCLQVLQTSMQVLLQPSKDVLTQRVQQRAAEGAHFMPASLLESQLALMEVDSSAYRYGETQQASLSASCEVGRCLHTSSCLDACD